jgi:hypothetical protein
MHHLQPPFEDTLEAGAVEAAGLVFGTKCLVVRVQQVAADGAPGGHDDGDGDGDDEAAANATTFEALSTSGAVGPSVCDHPTVFVVPLTLAPGALGYHPASQQWFVLQVDTSLPGAPPTPSTDGADKEVEQRKCLQVWASRSLCVLTPLCGRADLRVRTG